MLGEIVDLSFSIKGKKLSFEVSIWSIHTETQKCSECIHLSWLIFSRKSNSTIFKLFDVQSSYEFLFKTPKHPAEVPVTSHIVKNWSLFRIYP